MATSAMTPNTSMEVKIRKQLNESLDNISEHSYTEDPKTPFIQTNIMPEAFVPGMRIECGFFNCDTKLQAIG